MTLTFRLPVQLLGVLAWLWSALLWAAPVSATAPPDQALGQSIQYWQETGATLDLAQAVARYQSGQFTPGHTPVPVVRRLLIETAWLDRIDIYVRQQGKTLTTYQMGARWGGEEFILYLPDTPLHEASLLAERLRAASASVLMPGQAENLSITASLSVAQKRPEHGTLDTLINHADHNLYQSKALGRNRVTAD